MIRYFYMGKRITKVEYDTLSKQEPPFKRTLYSKDSNEEKPGVCCVCGCTMTDPCIHPDYGACSWADDAETLCSWCAQGVLNKEERKEVIHRFNSVRECYLENQKDNETK